MMSALKHGGSFMLFCSVALLAVALGQSPQSPPAADRMSGVRAFWHECLGKEAPAALVPMGGDRPMEPALPPGCVRAKASGTGEEVVFDGKDGTVFRYMRRDEGESALCRGRTHGDAVSSDVAWERALRILQRYGLSSERSGYQVELQDVGDVERRDDLIGAHWVVRKALSHEGLPCRGASVWVGVSALTGELWAFSYNPVLVPVEEHSVVVSKADAVKKVEQWLNNAFPEGKHGWKAGGKSKDKVVEVIARPHDPGCRALSADHIEDKWEAHYCWEVPYVFDMQDGEKWTRKLWVRVDTGEVIGGY
jgi:hypothetical protein